MRRLAWVVAVGLSGSACDDSDVGRCCTVIGDVEPDPTPTPGVTPDGDVINNISLDPAFDCESLTCVAFDGAPAYCTARCESDTDCPEGFRCAQILRSDPGTDAQIQPEDRHCVRVDPEESCFD